MSGQMKQEYSFRDKVRPFMRGVLIGGPLVEVALEGLRRGVGEPLASLYEERVEKRGCTRQIFAAFRLGRGGEAEERLAAAFSRRYVLEKEREACHIVASPASMHVPVYRDLSGRYAALSMWEVSDLISSGAVTSQKAQETLTSIMCAEGSDAHAERVLASGKLTSGSAILALRDMLGR